MTYAELAATNPEAGGLYCFIRDGFGRVSAFLYGWCLFLVIASGSVAALARAFTEHLAEIIPLSAVGKTVLSVVMIAVVTAVNVWGTRKSSNLQNWTTLVKVGIIVVLSAILLRLAAMLEIAWAFGSSQHGLGLLSNFGLAMIAVLWAYEGWQFGTYSAGEVVDPQRAFPRAFLFGSLTLAGLYVVAVIAYLVALGPAGATASNTIAATAVGVVLGRRAEIIVALTILVSTFSAANSVMLTAPRVFYAMANDNLFFKKLAEVHPRFHTPAAAIVALGTWSAVLACAGKFAELIGGVIFIGWIFYGLGAAAIFPLRRAGKGLAIPYRVPGYPWTPLLFVLAAAAIVGNAIVVAFLDPKQFINLAIAIALFLLGLPAYFFWRKRADATADVTGLRCALGSFPDALVQSFEVAQHPSSSVTGPASPLWRDEPPTAVDSIWWMRTRQPSLRLGTQFAREHATEDRLAAISSKYPGSGCRRGRRL